MRGVEGIRGTDFGDVFNAAGFYANSTNGGGSGITIAGGYGAQSSFNEFEGGGGNDQITGNMDTRIVYLSATGAVNVNLATGIATGDASVGTDTIAVGTVGQVRGSNFNDTFIGSFNTGYLTESFEGMGGDDFIDGNGGFDRVRYDNQNTGALGILVNLAAGTVTGRDAAATAVIGTDTLRSIESVRGSNAADIFNAAGFSATATGAAPNAGGDQGNFNEFEGMGGDDQITGNGATRIRYTNSTGAVTVNMSASAPGAGAGTATGNGSVGTDTFTGVNAVRGSSFNDTLIGSDNGANTTENFEGWGGDDFINGGLGFDRVRYDVNSLSALESLTLGVSINMTTGVVTGRDALAASIYGVDTLRKIESVRGTNAGDIYNAANFGAAGFVDPNNNNVGDQGAFNEFEGMGGNDQITGNGNTRITYVAATEGVTINLLSGFVAGGASVGSDTIIGGVNQVRGSNFVDTITGNSGANTIIGGGGDDIIDGGGGVDIAQFNALRAVITSSAAAIVTSVASGSDGTDQLSNIELLRFNDGLVLANATLNLTTFNGFPVNQLFGRNAGESLTIGQQLNGGAIDLGGGVDTLTLGLAAGGSYNFSLANVETVVGSAGNDTLTLLAFGQTGVSIDLGGGSDSVTFNGSSNVASVSNVEFLTGAGGNDTITFTQTANAATPAIINLGTGNDSLTLANNGVSGNNVTVSSAETIIGSSANDQVTITDLVGSTFISTNVDLGGGTNTLTLNVFGVVSHMLTLANVQTVNSTGGIETVNLQTAVNGVAFDLGAGADTLNLNFASAANTLSVANVETLNGSGGDDTITYFANAGFNNQINLYGGTNILNLAGANTTFSMNVTGNALTISGQNGVGESITLNNAQFGTTFNMGTGGGDSVSLLISSANGVSIANAEHVVGGNFNDSITLLGNSTGATEVVGGGGTDFITASSDSDLFRFASIGDSVAGVGRDQITGFDAAEDQFLFNSSIGFAGGSITYVGDLGLGGSLTPSGHAQAALINFGGQTILQIDANGDGTAEIETQLIGLTGALDNSHFLIV